MFAVFQSGGKQHRVTEGETLRVELLEAEPGNEVIFDKVLMIADGEDVNVGSPFLDGGLVKAEVVKSERGKKVHILKFRRRKDYMRRQGHRQWFTEVKITSING
jgi:large subunit ribosomal protein L21